MTDIPNYKETLADVVVLCGRGREVFRPPTQVSGNKQFQNASNTSSLCVV